MKVIDLLNKIANGEEVPEEISYGGTTYYFNKENRTYEEDMYESGAIHSLGEVINIDNELNNEVEIIEDTPKEEKKIPKKIKVVKDNSNDIVSIIYDDTKYDITILQAIIIDNINLIIDYLKSKGE